MSDTDLKFSKRAWMSLKHSPLADVIKFLVVIGLIIWLMGYGTGSLTYNWQWYRIPQYIFSFENGRFIAGPLIDGLVVTFQITGVSLIIAFFSWVGHRTLPIVKLLFSKGPGQGIPGTHPEHTSSRTDFFHLFCAGADTRYQSFFLSSPCIESF